MKESKKGKFNNAIVFYKNCGKQMNVNCTNRTLTKTLNQIEKCQWITDIKVKCYK